MAEDDLFHWVDAQVKDRYRTWVAFAKAVGRTDSALKRGIRRGSIDVDTLLIVARELGEPPQTLFDLAGKGDVGRLIQSLYGPARPTLPADVQAVVQFLQAPDRGVQKTQQLIVATAKEWLPRLVTPWPTGESAPVMTRSTRGTRAKRGARKGKA